MFTNLSLRQDGYASYSRLTMFIFPLMILTINSVISSDLRYKDQDYMRAKIYLDFNKYKWITISEAGIRLWKDF